MVGSLEVACQATERQLEMSHRRADDLSSLAYDLESMVEGWQYLHTWEMGPVEGETEVVVEPRE